MPLSGSLLAAVGEMLPDLRAAGPVRQVVEVAVLLGFGVVGRFDLVGRVDVQDPRLDSVVLAATLGDHGERERPGRRLAADDAQPLDVVRGRDRRPAVWLPDA